MVLRYSIAEARNRFAKIIHDLDHVSQVEVTRRGQPVAVLLSIEAFERMKAQRSNFWQAYTAFREAFGLEQEGIEPELFTGAREPSPGREVDW